MGCVVLDGGEEVGLFSRIYDVGVCLTFRGLLYILIILNLSGICRYPCPGHIYISARQPPPSSEALDSNLIISSVLPGLITVTTFIAGQADLAQKRYLTREYVSLQRRNGSRLFVVVKQEILVIFVR